MNTSKRASRPEPSSDTPSPMPRPTACRPTSSASTFANFLNQKRSPACKRGFFFQPNERQSHSKSAIMETNNKRAVFSSALKKGKYGSTENRSTIQIRRRSHRGLELRQGEASRRP